MSNSGDSLAVLVPLLAETGINGQAVILASYLALALSWALAAWTISHQRSIASTIEQRGARVLPWLLIVVGIYILLDTATDTLV